MLRLRFCTRLSTAPASMTTAIGKSAASHQGSVADRNAVVQMHGMDVAADVLSRVWCRVAA